MNETTPLRLITSNPFPTGLNVVSFHSIRSLHRAHSPRVAGKRSRFCPGWLARCTRATRRRNPRLGRQENRGRNFFK